jgi:uncharacterized SAM-binding protein YcdF (DUF218 family)
MTKVIVILGSPNDDAGNLSDIATSRCEQAFKAFNENPEYKVLCTGGFGEHFNRSQCPHAHYLKDYLIKLGIPSCSFIDITLSRFTFEDASLSIPVFDEYDIKEAILITSDFHMKRAQLLFTSIFPAVKFTFLASITQCDDAELQRLANHEVMATEREKQNLEKYFNHTQ